MAARREACRGGYAIMCETERANREGRGPRRNAHRFSHPLPAVHPALHGSSIKVIRNGRIGMGGMKRKCDSVKPTGDTQY